MKLTDYIRTIPDHPKPGIMFRDVTTLIGDPKAFAYSIAAMAEGARGKGITKVAGIEARGFIFGGAVAEKMGLGFVPLRKPGKLPWKTVSREYALEYGTDRLHMHVDACKAGDRVLVIDDLIATGGTAIASVELLRESGATVKDAAFVVDLPELSGADRLRAIGVDVSTLCAFDGH